MAKKKSEMTAEDIQKELDRMWKELDRLAIENKKSNWRSKATETDFRRTE